MGEEAVLTQEEVGSAIVHISSDIYTEQRVHITCRKATVTILLSRLKLGSLVFYVRRNIRI